MTSLATLALAHATGAAHAHGDTLAAVAGVLLVVLAGLAPHAWRAWRQRAPA